MLGEAGEPGRRGDAARGLLLGLAAGEAAGAAEGGAPPPLPLTRHTLAVAASLASSGRPVPDDLVRRWLELPEEQAPGAASTTGVALALARRGVPTAELGPAAARSAIGPATDLPLCRCLPIAVAAHRSGGAVRAWAELVAGVTHGDRLSQLVAGATALLARDLLTRELDDALARVAQAIREEAPESLVRRLRRGDPGEPLPGGDDAASVLAAAVQALGRAREWEAAVADSSSREEPDDQLPALVGALGGARWGTASIPRSLLAELPEGMADQLQSAADQLLALGRSGAPDAPPAWLRQLRR